MQIYDETWCPPPAQLQTAQADPNSTAVHIDTIKAALKFKAESVLATEQERLDALTLLRQLYPQEF
jgi:hypothetical protein